MSHLNIGHIYTALHAACASAVARIIEAHGIDVNYVDLGEDERLEAIQNKEVDILVSAWMPRDGALITGGGEVFGDVYRPQVVFSALEANNISATWIGSDFSKLIVTEEVSKLANSVRSSREDLKQLPMETVGEAALIQKVQQAHQNGDKPLIITWQPHAIFHTDLLRILPDTANLLGDELVAQFILSPGVRQKIDDDLFDELAEMILGNRVMNALDYAISVENIDPESAAESWQRGHLIGR